MGRKDVNLTYFPVHFWQANEIYFKIKRDFWPSEMSFQRECSVHTTTADIPRFLGVMKCILFQDAEIGSNIRLSNAL